MTMDADRTAVRVFDLIDDGKIGQAEGALETALARHPENISLRVAESLVLLRRDQPDKAKARAMELSSTDVKEPKAINALVHVFQQCCCWEELAAMYERLKPLQNERQMSENLVQTYVRMGAYQKAQQTATQLYRSYGEPKYQVWMVQACLGQVPPDSTDHLMLKLSAKLLDASVLSDKGVLTPPTVRTYVDVLVQQRQYEQAVAFLCSERGALIGLAETRLEVLARVLLLQGRHALANACAKTLWQRHPDNWTPFQAYLDSIHAGAKSDETLELAAAKEELRLSVDGRTADGTLDAAAAFARCLQATESSSKKPRRGPFLAELAILARKGGSDAAAAAALEAAVLSYVKRFSHKPCCYLDVSTFLTKSSADSIYAWSTAPAAAGESSASDVIARHTRRVLGLRCLVAAWGPTAVEQPPVEEMRALMAQCAAAYDETRALSASLEWNEEGHGDGYLSVALNVALHGYVASKDLAWVAAGLGLMEGVDRRMNNSVWLIFSSCFASLLGLADTAAQHQLSFKSVQLDTMTHLGYWPMVRGLSRDDVAVWESLALEYYGRVERDCSLLRAKVFTFTSWPAMQDVRRFQDTQERSLSRWLVHPHECAAALCDCQTQKNIFELFDTRGEGLWSAWAAMQPGAGPLADNTDWTVARSVVLGDIHGEKVRAMTAALVQVPSPDARLQRGRQLLCSLLLLRDIATLEQQRQAIASAPKPKKTKKTAAAAAGPAGESAAPVLYTPQLETSSSTVEFLPAIAPLARALRPFVESSGEAAIADGSEVAAAVAAHLHAVTDATDAASAARRFEDFLYPEAYLLAAFVRVLPTAKAPVANLAGALHACLQAALHRYETGEWTVTSCPAGAANAFTERLAQEKDKRVRTYLSDLMVDVAASSRRK